MTNHQNGQNRHIFNDFFSVRGGSKAPSIIEYLSLPKNCDSTELQELALWCERAWSLAEDNNSKIKMVFRTLADRHETVDVGEAIFCFSVFAPRISGRANFKVEAKIASNDHPSAFSLPYAISNAVHEVAQRLGWPSSGVVGIQGAKLSSLLSEHELLRKRTTLDLPDIGFLASPTLPDLLLFGPSGEDRQDNFAGGEVRSPGAMQLV